MDISLYDSTVVPLRHSLLGQAITMTKDRDSAEDLVQITMLRAWQAFDRFDGRHLKAWLFTILRNCFINDYRAQKRQPLLLSTDQTWVSGAERTGTLEDILFTLSEGRLCVDDVAEEALDALGDERIKEALSKLPAVFAEAMLLYDVEGYHYAEIAEMLDIPIGTVMSRIHRGRRALRESLKDFHETGIN